MLNHQMWAAKQPYFNMGNAHPDSFNELAVILKKENTCSSVVLGRTPDSNMEVVNTVNGGVEA